jgi:hypothetical protein
MPEAAPLIARLLGSCRTLAIEKRASGIAIRLQAGDEAAGDCLLTCVIHEAATHCRSRSPSAPSRNNCVKAGRSRRLPVCAASR